MKYLRKVAALIIGVVFAAALIIGMGVIFAVKNVNIELKSFTYEAGEQSAVELIESFRTEVLNKYRGTIIGFVKDDELAACFKDSGYKLESCERSLPCTLNLTLAEHREVFALAASSETTTYDIYDEEGEYLRTAANAGEELNAVDHAPNVLLSGIRGVNDIKLVASVSAEYKKEFGALRSMVAGIELQSPPDEMQNVTFTLHSGIKIRVVGIGEQLAGKLKKAHEVYDGITQSEQKLYGTVVATLNLETGEPAAQRFDN